MIFTPYLIKNGAVTKLEPISVQKDEWQITAVGFSLRRKPGSETPPVYQAFLNTRDELTPIIELEGYDGIAEPGEHRRSCIVSSDPNELYFKLLLYPAGTEGFPGMAGVANDIPSLIENSKKHNVDFFGFNIQVRPKQ
jgi:hypothetical protein